MKVYRLETNGALQPQRSLHFGNRFVLPESGMEIQRAERAAEHPVKVKLALKMVDLVLQDACIPSRGFDHLRPSLIVQALDAHIGGAGDDGRVSRQTETPFKELDTRRRLDMKYGIDDHVKGDWPSIALGDLLG